MVVEKYSYQQPTINHLLRKLINDFNNLLGQHAQLFRYELKQEAEIAAKYTGVALIGSLLGFTGLIFLGFFLIFALGLVLPLWTASFIVAIAYFLIAGISALIARSHLQKISHGPETTIQETRKTVEEAKKWLH